jgi:hypothetical protein
MLERFYGEPATIRAERVFPGAFDDATWAEAVEGLRSTFDTRGRAEQVGDIREWSAFRSSGFDYRAFASDAPWYTMLESFNLIPNATRSPVHVEAVPEADGTRVTMQYRMPASRLWEVPGLYAFTLVITLAVSLLFTFGNLPWGFLVLPVTFLVGGGAMGGCLHLAHRSELRTTRRRITKAMDRFEHLLADEAARSEAEGASRRTPREHAEERAPSAAPRRERS